MAKSAPRKLLIQANRNGFFYVLDRTNGKLLLAKPFIRNMNWAKEVGPDGKPVLLPLPRGATPNSVRVCPSQDGATQLVFCVIRSRNRVTIWSRRLKSAVVFSTRKTEEWEAGRGYAGGSSGSFPVRFPTKF